jgi:hypothetical protein
MLVRLSPGGADPTMGCVLPPIGVRVEVSPVRASVLAGSSAQNNRPHWSANHSAKRW